MKSASRMGLSAALMAALALPAWTQSQLAPTPPMGWNSWDSFGTTVTEAEVKANADYMAKRMAKSGWQYVVVDIQWAEQNPKTHGYRPVADLAMDANGRLIPAPNRFPSSGGGKGFEALAAYVHSKGLKFGIHIMRGIPRAAVKANLPVLGSSVRAADIANAESICPWNPDMYGVDVSKPGGQEYYDGIVRQYAAWGVDFIKADDMFGAGPKGDHSLEIAALNRAIGRSGRPIVLSLSPGTSGVEKADFIAKNAQMWRISDDFWDRWVDLKKQFPNMAQWAPFVKPGNWPDADMLPLGKIGIRAERGNPRMSLLTRDEQYTLMNLWCIGRSPLMVGGNLPDNDEFTLGLLTNDEVLAVNQQGTASRQVFARGDRIAWSSDAPGGKAKYLAVFNTGDAADEVAVRWSELGLPEHCRVRDLWTKKDLDGAKGGRSFQLAPHGSVLLRVTPEK